MKNKRPLLSFICFLASLYIGIKVKGVPISSVWSPSAIIMLVGGILLACVFTGARAALQGLLGKNWQAAKVLLIGIAGASGAATFAGVVALTQYLHGPQFGAAVATGIIPLLYGIVLCTYIAAANFAFAEK